MGNITNENEQSDHLHLQLKQLLEEAKPLMLPMFPDQQNVWVEESPLAQEIKSILAKHPEYYDEVRAAVGDVFPKPRPAHPDHTAEALTTLICRQSRSFP
jgi:hypothetical protein